MRLLHIAGGAPAVPLARVGADPELAADVQARLAAAGLLDPPADGLFGPVSQWALSEFLVFWGLAGASSLDMHVASALLQADAAFPLVAGDDLAGDTVRALQAAGHWLCRHPRALNIVYVADMGLDGAPSVDATFGDARLLLRVDERGRPQLAGAWEGSLHVGGPGAVHVACGQYKSWSVGLHQGDAPYDALVQTGPVEARNANGAALAGVLGLDQHCGDDDARGGLGRCSAGGLVGRSKSGHREFMAMVRSDPRYLACKGYRFLTSVLPLEAVAGAAP
ncbi:hypothetical protein H8N03_09900 [Ramlibacter sp. USB13]|uniref:Peptidoglycan-binding protein n=1 Tax=Ramlibacter cellulosilyticus TaxID=2764187 RepID=A0A923MP50_9BURK|nr:peptidoglycan-binding domain-containing protein [Ramlibacter cellulosilyticus]MBC5783257.1 hypothetical protein [Ramlibacter cellulosilyticus]